MVTDVSEEHASSDFRVKMEAACFSETIVNF
jgi:hypothetical protein